MNWHRSSKRREARAPQSRELLGRALKNGALKQMSTDESVAYPPASSTLGGVPSGEVVLANLYAFRPSECLKVLEPLVARVGDIGQWVSDLDALVQAHTAHRATQDRAQSMATIMRRLADAAEEVAWDLDLVLDALRAAQKGGCA